MQGLRKELGFGAELLGLCGLVVAQPVLAVFGAAPEELTARRASTLVIVAFAVGVVVIPAVALWLAELPFRALADDWRERVHRGFLGALFGLLGVEVAKEIASPPPWLLIALGLVLGGGFAIVALRLDQVRLAVRYLALAPLAFMALFLFGSPVSALVIGGGVGAVDVEVAEPAPVVFLLMDEFPTVSLLDVNGDLDTERFPGFADLAEDATWYRNTTTVAPVTPSAVPALLTGELPDELRPAPAAARFPDNLFTLLANSHELRVEESFTQLCPTELCDAGPAPSDRSTLRSLFGTARQVLGSVTSPWAQRADLSLEVPTEPSDPNAPERFAALVDRVGDPTTSGQPPLDFLHVLLPHQPFDYTAEGLRYEAPDPPRGVEFGDWFDDDTAAVGRQRHLWQVELADKFVGELIDELKAAGTYEESLVVVTADHGIAFTGDEPIRGVSEANSHETLWTPLFVKPPGQDEGSTDDGRVESIDILPTIAEVLGVELGDDVDGVSRLGGAGAPDLPARVLDWRFSTLDPDGAMAMVDAVEGFERMLAGGPPNTSEDPLAGQRIGPHGDLVGVPVDELDLGSARDIGLMVDIPAGGFDVAPGALELPAYFSGRYPGVPIGWTALALDDQVVAVAQTYASGFETSDLAALIPPDLLTTGEHTLEVFAIDGEGAGRTLHRIGAF